MMPTPRASNLTRLFAFTTGLVWFAGASWAAVIAVVQVRFGSPSLWLAISDLVMFAMAVALFVTSVMAPRRIAAVLAASVGASFALALLLVWTALTAPDGSDNGGVALIILMGLCTSLSLATLARAQGVDILTPLIRPQDPQTLVGRVFTATAGALWIGGALWAAVFVGIVAALGGDVLIDLLAILFMAVLGGAMIVLAWRGLGRVRLLLLTSLAAAGILAGVTVLTFIVAFSSEGKGGGEILVLAGVLSASGVSSAIALVSLRSVMGGRRRAVG